MRDQPADNINDNTLFELSTTELIDLYRKRKDRADLAWGQIMIRATFYERTQQENDKLVRLLRECIPHLEIELQAKVANALREYQEPQS